MRIGGKILLLVLTNLITLAVVLVVFFFLDLKFAFEGNVGHSGKFKGHVEELLRQTVESLGEESKDGK